MKNIHAYDGIPEFEIVKPRNTSTGKNYSLNHPKELVVSMRYMPLANNKNQQGWESDQKAYWSVVMERCPQCLDSMNKKLLAKGYCPRVNKTFIDCFPQYKDFNGQKLFHHHIGGNGDAVAMPIDAHRGYGEIHNVEKQLYIRDNAENYSRKCQKLYARNQHLYGEKSIEFQKLISPKKDQSKTVFISKSNKMPSVSDKELAKGTKIHKIPRESQNYKAESFGIAATQQLDIDVKVNITGEFYKQDQQQNKSFPLSERQIGDDRMGKLSSQITKFRREYGEPGTTSIASQEHNVTPENERANIREQLQDNQIECENIMEQQND